jgi:hypothetical protein
MARNNKVSATEVDPDLVELVKDGESVLAHPDQVAHWKSQGWVEIEVEAAFE